MKRIITLLLLVFALKANAQRLTFSSELGYFSNDKKHFRNQTGMGGLCKCCC